jgi:hypothetical protein
MSFSAEEFASRLERQAKRLQQEQQKMEREGD